MLNYWEQAHKRIIEATENRGVAEFARKVGVDRKTVEAWKKGAYPGVDIIGKIAETLGMEPWELLKPPGADESFSPIQRAWGLLNEDEQGQLLRYAEFLINDRKAKKPRDPKAQG